MSTLNNTITSGSILFLDTAPVINYVERKEPYFAQLETVFTRVDEGDLRLVTSAITLAECLYYPYKHKEPGLVQAFTHRLVNGRNVNFVPGYGVAVAGDTGGGIRGRWIDLGWDEDNYESWTGHVDVYYCHRSARPI